MRRKWLAAVVIVLFLCLAAGAVVWRLRHRPLQSPIRAAGAASLPVDTGIVTISGTVRAQHVVTFGPATKGSIEAFMADVGDEVEEGEAVARVGALGLDADRENAESDVRKAQDRVTQAESAVKDARLDESRAAAELEKARAVLSRDEDYYAKEKVRIDAGAIPRLEFEKAQAEHQSAVNTVDIMDKAWRAASDNIQAMQQIQDRQQALLDQALQKLQDVQAAVAGQDVRSPVEGWIVVRQGQIGQSLDAGDTLFQVATDLAALEVALTPPPEVLKRVLPGMQALVLIPEVTSAAISGDVKSIDDKAKEVVVEFVSGMPSIRPGMKADVRLKLN
jgi:multidrug efflux pump subunit AcrA (membrane-fusion protein)